MRHDGRALLPQNRKPTVTGAIHPSCVGESKACSASAGDDPPGANRGAEPHGTADFGVLVDVIRADAGHQIHPTGTRAAQHHDTICNQGSDADLCIRTVEGQMPLQLSREKAVIATKWE